MKLSREALKAKLLAETAVTIDQLLDWNERHPQPTLTDLEEIVLKLRKQIGERMAQALLTEQAEYQAVERPTCPSCGQPLVNKGYRPNQIESRAGSVSTKRLYYYCPACQRGIFPPG